MREQPKIVKDLIHSIGLLNNLTDKEVTEIVESQFRFTYETIRGMNFDDLTKEEIDNMKTNFYYKFIGKVFTTGDIVERQRKRDTIVYNNFLKKNEKRD